MRRGLTVFGLAAVVASAAGCFRPTGVGDCLSLGTCECRGPEDCAEGLECVDGKCTPWPDAGPPTDLGKPCSAEADCLFSLCLPPGLDKGRVCSVPCGSKERCPDGWTCKASGDGGVCAPATQVLCLPCSRDRDCGPVGDRCVGLGHEWACGKDCSFEACPAGYACLGLDGGASQCVPQSRSCDCTEVTAGLVRACTASSDAGVCFGEERCEGAPGWSGCNARTPAEETCNGVDDDCDGLVDGADPSLSGAGLQGFPSCFRGDGGACKGVWRCEDAGWACSARAPVPEVCNGLDDDCSGAADEPFRDAGGRYLDARNCGACGSDCEELLSDVADGGATCLLIGNAPSCAPLSCLPGYVPSPAAQPTFCRRLVNPSCRPCGQDSECATPLDRCAQVEPDGGTHCLQSCEPASPFGCQGLVGQKDCCLTGYTCTAVSGAKLCVPDSRTCECTAGMAGATRSCLMAAVGLGCLGLQTCEVGGTWSACDTHEVTNEICDGADNNCDGHVDEDFVGTQDSGTYDTDEHCGSCALNCKAQWSPAIQHAIGGCDAGPGRPPACAIVRCTSESVSAGKPCRLDGECAANEVCDPLYWHCVRPCATRADCFGATCLDGRCAKSCAGNGDCTAPAVCGDGGVCVTSFQFVDVDNDSTNGCECASSGAKDEPELYATYPELGWPYVDRNCDGIDDFGGVSLFVSAQSPQSLGTRDRPYRTLAEALAAFDPAVHSAILVAAGSYVERVVLRNGVRLFGGYAEGFAKRDVVAYPTLIEGPEPNWSLPGVRPGTVNAENITAETVLSGFTVRGYDVAYQPPPGGNGKSSYAIYVNSSSSLLRIANNRIVPGRGGDGATGAPGAAGTEGTLGGNGSNSRECRTANCAGESQAGGAGGKNLACLGSNGAAGAPSSPLASPQAYQPPLGNNGRGGQNNYYGGSTSGSNCKPRCYILGDANGEAAQNGADGRARTAGKGCVGPGVLSGDEWSAPPGGTGLDGTNGVGGGGGGAGGWAQNSVTGCTGTPVGDVGGSGGGGGGGGCGGKAGRGGGSGGSSFGVFILSAGGVLPTVEGNWIEVGSGGGGGNGGPGGYGGVGGAGGKAGVVEWPAWCAGSAGRGGRGGAGGAGSGGGGGCGGSAFGLAGAGISGAAYPGRNRFGPVPAGALGAPGAGGASPAGATYEGSAGGFGIAGAYGEL